MKRTSEGRRGWPPRDLVPCIYTHVQAIRMEDVMWAFTARNTEWLCPRRVKFTSCQLGRREKPQKLYISSQFLLCSLLSFSSDFSPHLSCTRVTWKRSKLRFSATQTFFPFLSFLLYKNRNLAPWRSACALRGPYVASSSWNSVKLLNSGFHTLFCLKRVWC